MASGSSQENDGSEINRLVAKSFQLLPLSYHGTGLKKSQTLLFFLKVQSLLATDLRPSSDFNAN